MTKNITIWIFSVLFLLITCVGIKDFYHTMTYDEVYIGSHFGAGDSFISKIILYY